MTIKPIAAKLIKNKNAAKFVTKVEAIMLKLASSKNKIACKFQECFLSANEVNIGKAIKTKIQGMAFKSPTSKPTFICNIWAILLGK